jgi:uncharacterized membrane protein SirB2
MECLALKTVHVASVATSYALFVPRGAWMIRDLSMLQRRRIGTVPHTAVPACMPQASAVLAQLVCQRSCHG